MGELRIGLVGCGGIGAVHARSWQQVEGARVVAACDADPARAEAVSGAAAYADFASMLESEALDAVDICTPPHLHAPVASEVLRRKIPTLCEKPLARTPGEARQIVEAAEASGTLLMTAFCHRFHPPIEFVRELIDSGKLGRVLMFRNRFGTRFAGVEKRWFSDAQVAGGGALMDTSIHSVDLFRHLVGEVASVGAAVKTFHPEIHGVEDSAAMVLQTEAGAIGTIEASWMTPWSANVVEVYGENGAAVVDYDTGQTRYRLAGDGDWTRADTGSEDRFVRELQHFAAVLRGEEKLRVTGRDGLRAVEIIHEAYGVAR
jgi:UDP-N-acetylglucosamine 3-dehydrogenase